MTESEIDDVRRRAVNTVNSTNSRFYGCKPYAPWLWEKYERSLLPLQPDPHELYHRVPVDANDLQVFPELAGRDHVNFNLDEDGEVYELHGDTDDVWVEGKVLKEHLAQAVEEARARTTPASEIVEKLYQSMMERRK